MTDPLALLPSELILRILEFCPTSSLASLTRLNRAWNGFIDETHQEAIYSIPGRTQRQPKSFLEENGARDYDCIEKGALTFSRYFEGVASSKDLCRRETLLRKNWDSQRPVTRETVMGVNPDAIWRFRPDFTRRWILSTHQCEGGVSVTDMDTGELLWREEGVGIHAHLEYCERGGCAVWDNGHLLEVWRVKDGGARGEFERVKVLMHAVGGRRVQVRGFQLRSFGQDGGTLCVVSNEGVGFVYGNICQGEVELLRTIEIEPGAVGHLDQSEEVVVYSMGNEGYHFFEKGTGRKLGILDPGDVEDEEREVFRVRHPAKIRRLALENNGLARQEGGASRRRTVSLEIKRGGFPDDEDEASSSYDRTWQSIFPHESIALEEDEWGAGMLCGNLFVGVSRGGRVLVCSNWRKHLENGADEKAIQIIECDTKGVDQSAHFDMGGWLSVSKDRIMFEVKDSVYVAGLTDEGRVREASPLEDESGHARASYALSTGSLAAPGPVSFMGLYEDCLMLTYTVLLPSQFRTEAIRVLSFASDLDWVEVEEEEEEDDEEEEEEEVWLEAPQTQPTPEDFARAMALIEEQNARRLLVNPNANPNPGATVDLGPMF